MIALEPGLYRATVRGVAGESIVLVGDDGNSTFSLDGEGNVRRCYVFTDARPLITLDISDYSSENLASLISAIDRTGHVTVAQSITEQTKPAKIPEPSLWGVVKAAGWPDNLGPMCHWVRDKYGWTNHGGTTLPWGRLVDPMLIRAGVNS